MLPEAAHAAPGDGVLTIRAVRDFNANGAYDPQHEPTLAGVRVTVTDGRRTVAATTGPDGTVVVPLGILRGGRYMVKMESWPTHPGLTPAFGGGGMSGDRTYVNVGNGQDRTVDVGLWDSDDYCADADLTTVCQVAMTKADGVRTVVTAPADARGETSGNDVVQTVSRRNVTGNLYGVAYRRTDRRIFTGAYAKRHTPYGPLGAGGIYVTDRTTGVTSQFTTVPNAGSRSHAAANDPKFDASFIPAVGTESLGDLELSDDQSTLFAVNLADKRLYAYDATEPTADDPIIDVAIPNPGCNAAGDWRPMGLGQRNGTLYVGGVCSAQSTQNTADLRAAVWTFNPATWTFGPAPILDQSLVFPRGRANNPSGLGEWNPWTTDNLSTFPNTTTHPEPMLSDIEEEWNGDLVLGFRDRYGDIGGYAMISPRPGDSRLITTITGGDINRACKNDANGFDWEGTGACPNNAPTRPNGGQAANVAEFYPGDWFQGYHQETAQGALALAYSEDRILSTNMDPVGTVNSGGVGFYDRVNGDRGASPAEHGLGIQYLNAPQDGGFGKANGLGDIELLCEDPPVQIGNRVWFDTNRGHGESPNEPGISGVRVTLLSENGTVLATTTTNANGEYFFGPQQGVRPNTTYRVRYDKTTANTTGLHDDVWDASDLVWANPDAWDDEIDSDAHPDGDPETANTATTEPFTTGGPGSVNHSIDAGLNFTPAP